VERVYTGNRSVGTSPTLSTDIKKFLNNPKWNYDVKIIFWCCCGVSKF